MPNPHAILVIQTHKRPNQAQIFPFLTPEEADNTSEVQN